MRDMLKVQELMDLCLDQRDEELRQLHSQSQANGALLAALSMQVQELISLVESRAEVVGPGGDQWMVHVTNTDTHFKDNSSMPRYS